MPLDSSSTINAFLAGYGTGDSYRKRMREQELNKILAGAYTPAHTGQAMVPQVGEMGESYAPQEQSVQVPGSFDINNAFAGLAKGGYGSEMFGLQQSQQSLELARQKALIDSLLSGANYQKTLAETNKTNKTAVSPMDIEAYKSALRQRETEKMMQLLGIDKPGAPSPQSDGFTKTINGRVFVKVGPGPADWMEYGQ